ncbi:MAG: CPBP family intramembrane metalloprotease [Planctomycetes bacterium]|nr:CPBP family intramembrane metalloprotease [Planctomycetota bacterium]
MKREGPALFFALVYPTLLAWFYFLLLAGGGGKPNPVQQAAYGAGKGLQFAVPLLFLWWCDGCLPRPGWPRFDRLTVAAGFSLLVLGGMFVLYFGALRGSSLFTGTPERIAEKLREFNLTTLPAYVGLSAFLSILHSFLEEYYWRWFVFGRLRMHLSFGPAAALSSLAFMSHHVIVLSVYLPGYFWTAVLPLSLCIAAGGFFWAWLYEQTRSIWAAWLSHLLIDAGILVIGYDLLRGSLFTGP